MRLDAPSKTIRPTGNPSLIASPLKISTRQKTHSTRALVWSSKIYSAPSCNKQFRVMRKVGKATILQQVSVHIPFFRRRNIEQLWLNLCSRQSVDPNHWRQGILNADLHRSTPFFLPVSSTTSLVCPQHVQVKESNSMYIILTP